MENLIYIPGRITSEEDAAAYHEIDAHAIEMGGQPYRRELFGIRVKHGDDIRGLVGGYIAWDWLYIDTLWVKAPQRHRGIGTELMRRAERVAREGGMIGIHLWTQAWQASEFYKKLGYEEFARFDDFPKGHQRIGLRKYL